MGLAIGGGYVPDVDTGGGRVHQEDAETVVRCGRDEHGVGDLRGRNQLLAAVEAPAVAVAPRGGRRCHRVRPPVLGQRCGEQAVSRDDLGEVPLLLAVVAVLGDGVGTEKQSRVHRHRRNAGAHLREKQRQFEVAVAAATDALGQRDSEKVSGCEFAPERSVVAQVTGFEFGQTLGGGAVFEELARDLGDRLLFFGEREVHACSLRLSAGRNWCRTRSFPSRVSNVS